MIRSRGSVPMADIMSANFVTWSAAAALVVISIVLQSSKHNVNDNLGDRVGDRRGRPLPLPSACAGRRVDAEERVQGGHQPTRPVRIGATPEVAPPGSGSDECQRQDAEACDHPHNTLRLADVRRRRCLRTH